MPRLVICLTGICDYPHHTNIRNLLPSDTGCPKFSPVAPGDQNKASIPKFKCEAIEISVVFINLYSVLSWNLDRAVPAADPLLS